MKKFVILIALLLVSACTYGSGGIRLYNFGTFWGGSTPNSITVRKGDTLYSIARNYDLPLREIIEANRLRPPYNLYVGQTLRLPKAQYHVVQKGDTLYNISKRYNTDMVSLSKANDLDAPYALNIGQKLVLPGSVVTPKGSNYAYNKPAPATNSESSWMPWKSSNAESSPRPAAPSYTPLPKRSSKFSWPVRGTIISNYGAIGKGRTNDGINIKAPLGTAVKAADAGSVAYAGNELKGFGNLILIKHNDGWVTAYAHNDKILVKKGQKIRKGEKISTIGSTGGVNTPQLHFEIRNGKKAINPNTYLQ